jgi:hypothetical protein
MTMSNLSEILFRVLVNKLMGVVFEAFRGLGGLTGEWEVRE